MKQEKWFDRTFHFQHNQFILPSVIERLWGTAARLEEKLKNISEARLNRKVDNGWSVKEHIGHLSDLEPLWQGRLADMLNGQEEQRATDLLNNQTEQANHNERSVEELVHQFRKTRLRSIELLEGIPDEELFKSALHPRLKIPMNVLDLWVFVAEHDDHHLASITRLIRIS
jgi:uncharacterized damage-inducible protein DinB